MMQPFYTRNNPESFVKYGKYEMRLMDEMRIDAGFMTKAKVKWWGGIDYQYPYLWKADKSDTDYQESWSDPRIAKVEKIEKQSNVLKDLKINREKKM